MHRADNSSESAPVVSFCRISITRDVVHFQVYESIPRQTAGLLISPGLAPERANSQCIENVHLHGKFQADIAAPRAKSPGSDVLRYANVFV